MSDHFAEGATEASFERRWRDRFESFAEHADDDAGIAGWTATGLATRLRQFARVLRPNLAGECWLDAGCGAGTYVRLLVQRGATVVGIDYSLPTVIKAREREIRDAILCVGDATRLPFQAGRFDAALCLGVTQALSASGPLVASVAATVRHGGEVWIDALNASCIVHRVSRSWRRLRGRPPHLRYEHAKRLADLMLSEGLDIVEVVWMPMLPPRMSGLQRCLEATPVRSLLRALPSLAAFACHSFLVHGRRVSAGETSSELGRLS